MVWWSSSQRIISARGLSGKKVSCSRSDLRNCTSDYRKTSRSFTTNVLGQNLSPLQTHRNRSFQQNLARSLTRLLEEGGSIMVRPYATKTIKLFIVFGRWQFLSLRGSAGPRVFVTILVHPVDSRHVLVSGRNSRRPAHQPRTRSGLMRGQSV